MEKRIRLKPLIDTTESASGVIIVCDTYELLSSWGPRQIHANLSICRLHLEQAEKPSP